jgi:acetaldehyde/propanal dehydrogenase
MRNTVHCLVEGEPDREAISASIARMAEEVSRYVPGYRLKNDVVFDGRRVSVFLEVEGRGDFLPVYAGNLDIMTASATRVGELFAEEMQSGRWTMQRGVA